MSEKINQEYSKTRANLGEVIFFSSIFALIHHLACKFRLCADDIEP